MRSSVEGRKVATKRGLLYKIQHKSITFLLKVSSWTSQLACNVGEILISPTNKVVVIKITTTLTLELDPAEHTQELW